MLNTEITFDERASVAVATVLEQLLATIEDNYASAIDGRDPEGLHDLRVALRRSRAVQRQLKGAFPRDRLAQMRAEFKWLQRATGPARDLDVYVDGFGGLRALVPPATRRDLQPLLALLVQRRRLARLVMERDLRSRRAQKLLVDWRSLLQELPEISEKDAPRSRAKIGVLAGARIRKLYLRMVDTGRRIGPEGAPEAYHELRKLGKELRYMLELFGSPLYPEQVVKPMIKRLKALQDVLGRHQDRHVQAALLRSLEADLAGDPASLSAVRALVAALQRDELEAREQFTSSFERFAAEDQRRLVQETFRFS